MSKYKYSKTEQQINNVLKYHDEELKKSKLNNLLCLNLIAEFKKAKTCFECLGTRKCRYYQSEKNQRE